METGSHEHRDAKLPAPRHNRSQSGYQTCNRTQYQNQTQKNEGYVGERSVRKRQIIAFVGAADPQEAGSMSLSNRQQQRGDRVAVHSVSD